MGVKLAEKEHLKEKVPHFQIGDTIKVETVVVEGERKRSQIFEGVVIRKRGVGMGETFTLRRTSYGEGVERTFPLHSPAVGKIVVSGHGKTRLSKLYYLRNRSGKVLWPVGGINTEPDLLLALCFLHFRRSGGRFAAGALHQPHFVSPHPLR